MNGNEEAWEIIRKSFRGSDEIDRMRGEINRFVKMVVGLYEPYCYNWIEFYKGVEFYVLNRSYGWEIKIVKKKLLIRFLYHPFPEYQESVVLYSSGGVELPHDRVAQAGSAISAFYTGMIKFELKDRLKPFLDAAEAAEKK